ncbi:Spindle poison sensitivity protein scp3 [Neofusicoccum parvum]|uniref:Spindle poison sensitivity protein scp3 n=1 Tax=Neofusicoccum parvum TaxID=310453 RepID=A0ACB5SIM5_9PEZI|nr:Spindle poison sensitivity protein scp3 [Neofusicoccum parvum]
MPAFAPQFPPQPAQNGNRVQHRHSRDFSGPQTNGQVQSPNGSQQQQGVPIQHRAGNGHQGHVRGMSGFDGPRSPPNSKSERARHKKHPHRSTHTDSTELKGTAHVPCKFYRQGVCQAGKACPFLHTNDLATETAPCKYFQKGNCKFGAKCALAHILPDGRRVNGPNLAMGRHPYGRPAATQSSLLTMQAMAGGSQYPYMPSEESFGGAQPKHIHDMIPTIDQTFSSNPGSNFGSPPNDGRLPTSPVQKGLSVLDAPLPASFDSQGISHMARYGPIAASVPSRFGLESTSPPSSYQNKAAETSTLRNLHSSAFGDDARARNGLGSSPPTTEEPVVGRRIMHSERFSRPKMMSASLGTRPIVGDDPWDENFAFEEDLVPNSLHELLTPQEKMRRFSRAGEDEHGFNHRQSLSGLGTPGDSKPATAAYKTVFTGI